MAPIDELTEEETLRLLKLTESDKGHNWDWLVKWLNGSPNYDHIAGGPSTPERVLTYFEKFENDPYWTR